ncbi:TapA domain-containing protein [Achromobacter sp. HZ28]|nr:TapA domain-containing protein [Achromobacter sp. HZ28]OWT78709.1 TapA domain-containing protein [Achromobacter sp. HZ34]
MSSAALAQTNAPLTGAAGGAGTATTTGNPGAAPPAIPTVTAQPAAVPADSTLSARPVVRQVNTPMPVSGADTAAPPQGPAFAEPRPSAATPAPVDVGPTGTGGITRALLAAQGDGRRAAPAQPTLGVVATAAFDRYLDSFKLPIPQWFQERVKTDQSQ